MAVTETDVIFLFSFQWACIILFTLCGAGYHALFIRSKDNNPNSFWIQASKMFILGLSLLILIQVILSIIPGTFSAASVLYLVIGLILFCGSRVKLLKADNAMQGQVKQHIRSVLASKDFFPVFLILVFASLLSSIALSGFYNSTVFDGAAHSFLVRVILEQQRVPLTPAPYYTFLLAYPVGSHVLMATFVILGTPIHLVVLMSTSFLPLATALVAYSSMSTLFRSRTAGLAGSIFGAFCSATLVANLGWGGFPIGIGNLLLISMLGSSYRLLAGDEKDRTSVIATAVSVSIIPWCHPAAATVALVWLSICLICGVLLYVANRFTIGHLRLPSPSPMRWLHFILALGILAVPYLFRILTLVTAQDMGYPPDVGSLPSSGLDRIALTLLGLVDFNLILDIRHMSEFAALFGSAFSIFLLSIPAAVLMLMSRRTNAPDWIRNKLETDSIPILLLYISLIVFILFFRDFLPSLDATSPTVVALQGLTGRHFYQSNILILPLSAYLLGVLIDVSGVALEAKHQGSQSRLTLTRPSRGSALVLFIACIILIAQTLMIARDTQMWYKSVSTQQETYNIVTVDDLNVIHWMGENLQTDSVILVGYDDAGQYVTAITGLVSIHNYIERIRSSAKYNLLLELLAYDPRNETVPIMLSELDITHVFVGSDSCSVPTGPPMNKTGMMGSPWFVPVFQSGNSTALRFLR